jgi:hypothetical protein
MSCHTYTADNCAPVATGAWPPNGTMVPNDGNVVIEVMYSDDCDTDTIAGGGNNGGTISKTGGIKMSVGDKTVFASNAEGSTLSKGASGVPSKNGDATKGGAVVDRDGRNPLDDNGSGISLECVSMTIVPPEGEPIVVDGEGFLELDNQHAKYILTPPHTCGPWTVNFTFCDCVGNLNSVSWQFGVECAGPTIVFNAVEDSCTFDGFWNPNTPLDLNATIREIDNVNINASGIRVDVIRVYDCSTGVCTDTILANAAYDITPDPDAGDRDQVFTITGSYTFDGDVEANDVRIVVSATNALGATTTASQTWIVDGTPPTIEIVSPQPGSTLSEANAVTISANFMDDDGSAAASLPGGDKGFKTVFDKAITSAGKAAKGGRGNGTLDNGSSDATRIDLGAWRDAVTRGLDDLDGNSGVDPACVELHLVSHTNGDVTDLTEDAFITANNITWVGNLESGSYTAILTVCDRVCNVASVNWSFVVTPVGAIITFDPPYHVSAMPHTFRMHVNGDNVDMGSLRLDIEGAIWVEDAESEQGGFLVWSLIIENAPVQWAGDSAWYTANFDLENLQYLRLTVDGNFQGGTPIPSASQVYTVDTGAPVFCEGFPQPPEGTIIPIGDRPTFTLCFEEVGNTSIESITVRLTTAGGEEVPSETTVSIAPNGRTGTATLTPNEGLAAGDYILYGTVVDEAGNTTSRSWNYHVGAIGPIVGGETFNYPNPFTPEDVYTTFHLPFEAGSAGGAFVQIKIYDFSGNYVATVFEGTLADPNMPVRWYATNDSGEEIANGVYLAHVRVEGGGRSVDTTVKVAYMKESK